jgi:hypothetical protein
MCTFDVVLGTKYNVFTQFLIKNADNPQILSHFARCSWPKYIIFTQKKYQKLRKFLVGNTFGARANWGSPRQSPIYKGHTTKKLKTPKKAADVVRARAMRPQCGTFSVSEKPTKYKSKVITYGSHLARTSTGKT